MNASQRALALIPSLLAVTACQHLADFTRDAVGLDETPVRTEPFQDDNTLIDAGRDARARLHLEIGALVAAPNDAKDAKARDVFRRAEEYYHIGRLAFRSQCEGFMQTLASVDGQTTLGQNLANNFFDTATVAATVTQSPVMWATGLSVTQNAFNSVSESTERYVLLSDSVGALRERVLGSMAAGEGAEGPNFDRYRPGAADSTPLTPAVALSLARQSIEAVQEYGAPCTEGGIRQIIADALGGDELRQQAARTRNQSYADAIRSIINTNVPQGEAGFSVTEEGYRLLYLWTLSRGENAADETRGVREQIEHELSYLGPLKEQEQARLSYFVQQQFATQRREVSSYLGTLRTEVLARRALREEQAPTEPAPEPKGE
ncbi:MAG: hypothetical protein ABL864_02160 [Terricaulis sp.]|jgi:hypothetical protein